MRIHRATGVLVVGDDGIGRVKVWDGTDVALVDASGNLNTTVSGVIPGTGATQLGKAIGDSAGATDTGVAFLAKHEKEAAHVEVSDGEYIHLHVSELGGLWTKPEQKHHFDEMDATTGWAAFDGDTTNLLTTSKHLTGTNALTFDKANTGADNTEAGIEKTITAVNLGDINLHDVIQTAFYLPSLSGVAYVFARVGTNSSNYNEWRAPVADLTAAIFEVVGLTVGDADHDAITGTGWNPEVITYIAVGVGFDAETNTLAGIIFDQVGFFTNHHTVAEIGAEITSSVSSANVNLQKVGGSPTSKGAGAVGNGTQRIVLGDVTASNAALQTTGDEANDAGDAGNPLKIGGRAQAMFAVAEQVNADNDRVDALYDRNGYLRTRGELNPQSAVISDALSGDNEIIGTPGANLRLAIYGYSMIADGTVLAAWESAAGGTALTGRMSFQDREGISVSPGSMPLFICSANQALNLELSAAVAMQGHVTYAIWNDA